MNARSRTHSLSLWTGIWLIGATFLLSCGEQKTSPIYQETDSLNQQAYRMRYKNLDATYRLAQKAYDLSEHFPSLRAEALNNLGFCAFIRMDFDKAENLFHRVHKESNNELECLVADIGLMKICQRTAMNKEFYDNRNRALRRMKRINDDRSAITNSKEQARLDYALSEFAISSAVYYYYLQQKQKSLEAINGIQVGEALQKDTAQWLYYTYMKGSGDMHEGDTPQSVMLDEFNYLIDCLGISHDQGYVYFEANALQALAELLKEKKNFDLLQSIHPNLLHAINTEDLPWEQLVIRFARRALYLFEKYGDWYQTSSCYRTLASCYNEQGCHEEALDCLTMALDYVNRHHETYYHCTDTTHRLRSYVPHSTSSVELEWINTGVVRTVPEWIARLREQLSVTYAALNLKPQSDYNRNVYLDLLDYTRQDKELESRYHALKQATTSLDKLLLFSIAGILLLTVLLKILSRKWRKHNKAYIDKLKEALEICRKVTAISVPTETDIVRVLSTSVKEDILHLTEATDMLILPQTETVAKKGEGHLIRFPLNTPGQEQLSSEILLRLPHRMKKEDKALMQVIVPYISWAMKNGSVLASLDEERNRLEKELYVHEQRLSENKCQNLVKKACLSVVTGITPYLDRIINEIHKLANDRDENLRKERYHYIDELITRINEYNDILTLWIKMKQGTWSLNIENFELKSLFEVLQKGRKSFEMKRQTLTVIPTDAMIRADKALTLFMINTLTENARKYTPPNGQVEVFSEESDDYVEISVRDNGPGLSREDVDCILNEKVYDSGKIGLQTAPDIDELRKAKGHGFGLMNCRGIIEKYKKTSEVFRVCLFHIESEPGKGSRFYFRLPRGVRKALTLGIFVWLGLTGCHDGTKNHKSPSDATILPNDSLICNNHLLSKANEYAYDVYNCNLEGQYLQALAYADSTLQCLNLDYKTRSGEDGPWLTLEGEGMASELTWFGRDFETDYYALLDVRNESAVAFLALGEMEAYRYNNNAYTTLYKQISKDASLESYCRRMQLSANHRAVAVTLCSALILILLARHYVLYYRYRIVCRYKLEQVNEINQQILAITSAGQVMDEDTIHRLAEELSKEVNELLPVSVLSLAIRHSDTKRLNYAFSCSKSQAEIEMRQRMIECYDTGQDYWEENGTTRCLPLQTNATGENNCMGVLAIKTSRSVEREEDRLALKLVACYLSVVTYNAEVLIGGKHSDIETIHDNVNRTLHEENRIHVQNLVLDNCLSTLKHETVYYPNRIKQIINHLNSKQNREDETTISELIGYYKDIFTLLSSCAARQAEDVTFRRKVINTSELTKHATRYFRRMSRHLLCRIELRTEAEEATISGDATLLKFLFENLIDEALFHEIPGVLVIRACKDKDFMRFEFTDTRRDKPQEELNQLFYPHLSAMRPRKDGKLAGTEYLICKQIIREHDEYAGRRGCRMESRSVTGGGFTVQFTVPLSIRPHKNKPQVL